MQLILVVWENPSIYLASFSPTALLDVLSARCVPEEQKLCKQLLKTAHRVGQVSRRFLITIIVVQHLASMTAMASGSEQVCTSPPVRLCVKSAAAVSSRSTGDRKTATCARKIITALWELCLTREKESVCYKKKGFHMFCNKDCCPPPESRCKSHSVSQWCILSRRQSGPQLLHGDFLP